MRRQGTIAIACGLFLALVFAGSTFGAQEDTDSATHMHVCAASSGMLTPIEGEENAYILTLAGVSAQVAHHVDYPEHVVTSVDMGEFAASLAARQSVLAVVELMNGAEDADVLPMRLSGSVYDPETGTLTHRAEVVSAEDAPSFLQKNAGPELADRADAELPRSFGTTRLYVDSPGPPASAGVPCGETRYHECVLGLCTTVKDCSGGGKGGSEVTVSYLGAVTVRVHFYGQDFDECATVGFTRVCVQGTTNAAGDRLSISVKGCTWALKWHCVTVHVGTFDV